MVIFIFFISAFLSLMYSVSDFLQLHFYLAFMNLDVNIIILFCIHYDQRFCSLYIQFISDFLIIMIYFCLLFYIKLNDLTVIHIFDFFFLIHHVRHSPGHESDRRGTAH